MRVETSRMILLFTLLSGFTLDLTAFDAVNHSPQYMEQGSAPVPSSSASDDPFRQGLEAASTTAVDSPGPAGSLFLLILAAVTAAATTDVLAGELKRRRTARPEFLALNLFVRGRLDVWEELH